MEEHQAMRLRKTIGLQKGAEGVGSRERSQSVAESAQSGATGEEEDGEEPGEEEEEQDEEMSE